jgi:hypothetical protein
LFGRLTDEWPVGSPGRQSPENKGAYPYAE